MQVGAHMKLVINRKSFFLIILSTAVLSGLVGGLFGGLLTSTLRLTLQPAAVPGPTQSTPETPTEQTSGPDQTSLSLTDFSTTITEAVERVSPAVVTVLGSSPGASSPEISGSGVIISPEGYILTNQHVIEDARETRVILFDGREIPTEVIGSDSFADLAVLQADPAQLEEYAVLGNSEILNPGEPVIAIGSPLGKFQNTVTVGVVSATERMLRISENYQMEGLVQTDAAINQGNSGGPLVNLAGEVIGINTLIVRGGTRVGAEGLGFAIPSNMAEAIASQIIEQGYVARPYLGIRWEWINPRISQAYNLPVEWGAFVSSVLPGTPADQAGLRRGDIIIQLEEQSLGENTPFINALYQYAPGETITCVIQRGEEQLELPLTFDEQPGFDS
jgi:2-alkenal reductase